MRPQAEREVSPQQSADAIDSRLKRVTHAPVRLAGFAPGALESFLDQPLHPQK